MIIEKTAKRLADAMDFRDIKQAELSRLTGIRASSLSDYLNGKYVPKQDKIDLLARALNITPSWLLGYDVSMNPAPEITNLVKLKTKPLPLLGSIAAGTPILADQNIEQYIEVDDLTKADFCLRVRGDSMIGANICDGDVVFIREQPEVEDGEIAAVLINGIESAEGEATLKRVYRIDGGVQLVSENPKYRPIICHNGNCENVKILGKATHVLAKVI